MIFSTLFAALALAVQQAPFKADLPAKYLTPPPAPSRVLARVDGVEIKASDVEPFLWDWRADEALMDLISYQMAKAEAASKGVQVPEKEIEAEVDRQIEAVRSSLQPGQTPEQSLKDEGFPRSRLYLRVASQLLIDGIVLRQFDPKEYVNVSTIVIKPVDEQASSLSAALKKAEDAYSRLQGGEPWETVLASLADPAGRPSGGPVGWRPLSAFPDTVRSELEKLEPGKVTKPAQTSNGIQIFRMERQGSAAVGVEMDQLKATYLTGARQSYAKQLRDRVKIERFDRGGLEN
ncbi:MAG: peptidyl-prolyl cis-trans isomerase [Fimbriimonadaceae bacterium]|nr:peptidylprolyl isomerase [Chthonomonadaceae bacterium]MCO5297709.1 peptidyl-prolyl cis-trans isomerase [Fimbriimonadaceae bacterium]